MIYNKNNDINQKKVKFATWILVYPNPNSLITDNISYLWWTENDKLAACYAMNKEIRSLQHIHPNMTIKQAMKLLYQPNNIVYDKNNFEI
jgi:hypothetical protein